MKNKAKILLVDDHAVVRAGFKLLLTTAAANVEVIAEADRGEQAIQQYQIHQPDIVIMDLSMPGIGGLETIKRIMQRNELAKILVFSVHDESVYIHRALKSGARGYITKNSAPHILPEAIDSILLGQTYIEQGLIKEGDDDKQSSIDYQQVISEFSVREFDIFNLLAKGFTAHKIAEELCLGYKTVANYVTQIKKKLQTTSVAELVHIAVLLGVIKQS